MSRPISRRWALGSIASLFSAPAMTRVESPEGEIIDRWPYVDRTGSTVGETVVMDRGRWSALPDGARPSAVVGAEGRAVMLRTPTGPASPASPATTRVEPPRRPRLESWQDIDGNKRMVVMPKADWDRLPDEVRHDCFGSDDGDAVLFCLPEDEFQALIAALDMPAVEPADLSPHVTFDSPVWMNAWLYTVRIWSPTAWDRLPEGHRPEHAARMNDQGWRWAWLLDGPSERLVRHWDVTEDRYRRLSAEHEHDPSSVFHNFRIDRSNGDSVFGNGEVVTEGSESLSSNPPTDRSRLAHQS